MKLDILHLDSASMLVKDDIAASACVFMYWSVQPYTVMT